MQTIGRTLLNFAFLFALVVWGGMTFFFVFQTTPVVFDTLDRDTAARLLGELFPRYFTIQLACVTMALVIMGLRLLWGAPRRPTAVGVAFLAVSLAISLYATFNLLPRMQEAQARVPSFVTTPKDAPERVAYGKLHGQTMILNAIAALLGGATLGLTAFEPRLLASASGERRMRYAGEKASAGDAPLSTTRERRIART